MSDDSNPVSAHYIWLYVTGASFLGSLALGLQLGGPLAWLLPISAGALFNLRLTLLQDAREQAADAAARSTSAALSSHL